MYIKQWAGNRNIQYLNYFDGPYFTGQFIYERPNSSCGR